MYSRVVYIFYRQFFPRIKKNLKNDFPNEPITTSLILDIKPSIKIFKKIGRGDMTNIKQFFKKSIIVS